MQRAGATGIDRSTALGQAGSGQGERAGPAAKPADTEVLALETDTGDATVVLEGPRKRRSRELTGLTIRVHTVLRGEYIWAWTLGEKVEKP